MKGYHERLTLLPTVTIKRKLVLAAVAVISLTGNGRASVAKCRHFGDSKHLWRLLRVRFQLR